MVGKDDLQGLLSCLPKPKKKKTIMETRQKWKNNVHYRCFLCMSATDMTSVTAQDTNNVVSTGWVAFHHKVLCAVFRWLVPLRKLRLINSYSLFNGMHSVKLHQSDTKQNYTVPLWIICNSIYNYLRLLDIIGKKKKLTDTPKIPILRNKTLTRPYRR